MYNEDPGLLNIEPKSWAPANVNIFEKNTATALEKVNSTQAVYYEKGEGILGTYSQTEIEDKIREYLAGNKGIGTIPRGETNYQDLQIRSGVLKDTLSESVTIARENASTLNDTPNKKTNKVALFILNEVGKAERVPNIDDGNHWEVAYDKIGKIIKVLRVLRKIPDSQTVSDRLKENPSQRQIAFMASVELHNRRNRDKFGTSRDPVTPQYMCRVSDAADQPLFNTNSNILGVIRDMTKKW